MDFICNQLIPKITEQKFILKPTSKTFITGIAKSYEITFFEELRKYIDQKDFLYALEEINETLESKWPCCFCFTFGYLMCPVSAGLSFFCPYVCIRESQEDLLFKLEQLNKDLFNPRKLTIAYKTNCLTSWIQININDYEILNKKDTLEKENEMISFDNQEK